jgi:hypothetical protein
MKTMINRGIGRRKLNEVGNRPSKTLLQSIFLLVGVIAAVLCSGPRTTLAAENIDEEIRWRIERLDNLSADLRFYDMIVRDPEVWVVPALDMPVPIAKNQIIDAHSAFYRKQFIEGKRRWEQYDKKELSARIMESWEFTKAFKAELKTIMKEIKDQQSGLRTEIAALEKKRAQKAQRSAGAAATASARILSATDWTDWEVIELSEYGFSGKFNRVGEGEWKGNWGGGCESTVFRLSGKASTTIPEMGQFNVVLIREDGDETTCPFSPGLRAEYQLKVTPSERTVDLKGKRMITNPGSDTRHKWLRNNTADVSGKATLSP